MRTVTYFATLACCSLLITGAANADWAYEAGVNIGGRSGNSERTSIAGQVKATKKTESDKLLLYVSGAKARENGNDTASEIKGGIDFEANLTERSAWYVKLELEHDEIELLQLRTQAAAGYGYYFIKSEKRDLRGRLGLAYRHETYDLPAGGTRSESHPGMELGLLHRNEFGWAKLTNEVTWSPSFDDFASYLLNHESALTLPIADGKMWNLQLGVSNQYNSEPAAGKDELDTTYFARLVLNWK